MSNRNPAQGLARHLPAAGLALCLLAIYLITSNFRSGVVDELTVFAVARNLVRQGSFRVGMLARVPGGLGIGSTVTTGSDGSIYAIKDLMPSLLIVPGIALARLIHVSPMQTAYLIPPAVTALTAVLVYLTAIQAGFKRRTGLWAGLLYGLGTLAWPYSKTLFTQPVGAFGVALAIYGVCRALSDEQWHTALIGGVGLGIAGMSFVAAWVTGPIFVLALLFWPDQGRAIRSGQWQRRLLAAAAFASAAALFLIPQGAYNWLRFGSVLETGYQQVGSSTFELAYLPMGLLGQLFSTSKGLLWYVPLSCLCVPGVVVGWRTARAPVILSLATFAVVFLLYGLYPFWWGGAAWGLRYLVPVMPALSLMVLPWLDRALGDSPIAARAATAGVALLSVATQGAAALIDTVQSELVIFGTFMNLRPIGNWPSSPVISDPAFLPWPRLVYAFGQGWWFVRWLASGAVDWPILAALLALAVAGCVLMGLFLAGREDQLVRGWTAAQLAASLLAAFLILTRYPQIADADEHLYGFAIALAAHTLPGDGLVMIIPNQSFATWLDAAGDLPEIGLNERSRFTPEVEGALRGMYQDDQRLWIIARVGAKNASEDEIRQWLARAGAAPDPVFEASGYRAALVVLPASRQP